MRRFIAEFWPLLVIAALAVIVGLVAPYAEFVTTRERCHRALAAAAPADSLRVFIANPECGR